MNLAPDNLYRIEWDETHGTETAHVIQHRSTLEHAQQWAERGRRIGVENVHITRYASLGEIDSNPTTEEY